MSKLKQFNECIDHAMSLTGKDIILETSVILEEAISWWKKKASKRFEKLKSEDRVRTKLEIWGSTENMELLDNGTQRLVEFS